MAQRFAGPPVASAVVQRPKSVTLVWAITSGAGNRDAIIASPRVFLCIEWISRAITPTGRAHAWENCLFGEKPFFLKDHLVRIIE
jgi:hypothetical protein